MRRKIFWTLQFIVIGVLLIYAVFSSQILYDKMIANQADFIAESLSKIDLSKETLSEETASLVSGKLFDYPVVLYSIDGENSWGNLTAEWADLKVADVLRKVLMYSHGYEIYSVNEETTGSLR